jgi:predicted enzyme related to lactoylglutathione lyase
MSNDNPEVGSITWIDLTISNAEEVRDFYKEVVGWKPSPVPMGDYDDYNMNTPGDDQPVAGVCHARGGNADLPTQWLIYITVEDVNKSSQRCVEMGGKIISGPKEMSGYGKMCVIQDPAGVVAALFEVKS